MSGRMRNHINILPKTVSFFSLTMKLKMFVTAYTPRLQLVIVAVESVRCARGR